MSHPRRTVGRSAPAEHVLLINSMTTAGAHSDVVMHPDAQFSDVCPGANEMRVVEIAARLAADLTDGETS